MTGASVAGAEAAIGGGAAFGAYTNLGAVVVAACSGFFSAGSPFD